MQVSAFNAPFLKSAFFYFLSSEAKRVQASSASSITYFMKNVIPHLQHSIIVLPQKAMICSKIFVEKIFLKKIICTLFIKVIPFSLNSCFYLVVVLFHVNWAHPFVLIIEQYPNVAISKVNSLKFLFWFEYRSYKAF